MKKQCQVHPFAGTAQTMSWLWSDQMGGVLAGIHTVPSQLSDLLAQLWRIPGLSYEYEHLPELGHMAVNFDINGGCAKRTFWGSLEGSSSWGR
ncbi:hypothetical protein M5D96_004160 [Drosophila gunungcola]|uniref:Uncharacterized protein n=1 Tax=Drosophila gunungcola TaxID=103775 RepID=A0A9P9YTK2_9MUSC|nr:hypothetical protein M5D96_004160 [Drosophila gunungcola]